MGMEIFATVSENAMNIRILFIMQKTTSKKFFPSLNQSS